MLTGFFVLPAAIKRSVCLHKNAGIWIISTTSETGSACSGKWMSVNVGTSISDFTLSSIFNPSSIPSPLNEVIDERFALSKELL